MLIQHVMQPTAASHPVSIPGHSLLEVRSGLLAAGALWGRTRSGWSEHERVGTTSAAFAAYGFPGACTSEVDGSAWMSSIRFRVVQRNFGFLWG